MTVLRLAGSWFYVKARMKMVFVMNQKTRPVLNC